ncbi:hypothetical protein GY45DRAFT_1338994 [Cubamyces sp. BRFM 1775]|nr:hypothetical protein GY45DRAFT_1338994 [Cubamyces sp. BRFM 1775]
MADKAVRLTTQQFVEHFWPIPHGVNVPPAPDTNPFVNIPTLTSEAAIAQDFVQYAAICNYTLTPGMLFRLSTGKADVDLPGGAKSHMDGAFFRLNNPVILPADGRPHYADQAIGVEFKASIDPFSDGENPCPEARDQKEARGQVISHTETVFSVQHRVAFFVLVVVGKTCRITLWDRSGVLVTTSFDYCTNWVLFCEILWRMSQCPDEQLGCDPTARRIYPWDPLWLTMDRASEERASDADHKMRKLRSDELLDDSNIVFSYVREMFSKSLEGAPRYVLDVPDGNAVRQYLIGHPTFVAKGMACRGTEGFVALDRQTEEFAWLKDCWRNNAGVPNVPTKICYGDLRGQFTITPQMWRDRHMLHGPKVAFAIRAAKDDVEGACPPEFDSSCPLHLHLHTRLVVKEVGLPLKEFLYGIQLLNVVADCVEVRVRPNGVRVITWTGLLCDWELSKPLNWQDKAPRRSERSGTWQFMSAALLQCNEKKVEISDELESFFNVILYHAVRYLDSNLTPKQVGIFIDEYFDQFKCYDGVWTCGNRKLQVITNGQ